MGQVSVFAEGCAKWGQKWGYWAELYQSSMITLIGRSPVNTGGVEMCSITEVYTVISSITYTIFRGFL